MKIIVYGANGWIGNQFVEILIHNKCEYIKGVSRVDNENDLLKEIEEYNPTHIVSFIGRTHGCIDDKKYTTIDYLEQKGKLFENVRDNLFSPLLLAKICTDKNVHFTYLGTGCIFAYDENHPFEEELNGFTEESLPNFFGSSYSVVKGFTDRLMKLYSRNVLNLRIRMPITGEKNTRNFITKITTYEKICSIKNSMSVLPELLPLIIDMMEKNTTGTVNFTNPGLISHNEILEMYKEIVNPNFTWNTMTLKEQNDILLAERSNNILDTSRLTTLYPTVYDIKKSIRILLSSL